MQTGLESKADCDSFSSSILDWIKAEFVRVVVAAVTPSEIRV